MYNVTASNFLPNTVLTYTCTPLSPGTYTGPETGVTGGAQFQTVCTATGTNPIGPEETITVTDGVNTVTATGTN